MNDKYPPRTTAALVPYSSLTSFSEVVPAEKMAELERKCEFLEYTNKALNTIIAQWEKLASK